MKNYRKWTISEAITELNANKLSDDQIIVEMPFNGLRQCSAFDYLRNHTSMKIICTHKKS